MKAKYCMVIDSSKCFNCKACIVSCQLENDVALGFALNWLKDAVVGEAELLHFQPGNCMHCDKPTCVEACPTGATFKDSEDGIVKVNDKKCIGCGSCIPSCPYNARYLHPESKIVDKCDYCVGRRAVGKSPACVETCPTEARVFGNLFDPQSPAALLLKNNETVRVVNNQTDTDPVIYYLGDTAPLDWPVKAIVPFPIQFWKDVGGTIVKGVVGSSGLVVLGMLGKQLLTGDGPSLPGQEREEGGNG